MTKRRTLASATTALVLSMSTGCAAGTDNESGTTGAGLEVAGQCLDAYGTDVCTWATLEADAVVAVGATVPMSSIEAAPAEVVMTWPPPTSAAPNLPEAATEQHGLTHMTMYWEPMGHTPVTYLTPHFDFHFYLIPPSERLEIDCSDESKPATLPGGYSLPDEQLPPELVEVTGVETLVGVCVPEMGMHSLVTAEMEVEEPFEGTMIVGYYGGEPIFLEPMISKAKLQERASFELEVPAVPGFEEDQPTVFRADYDEGADAYRFTFAGFRLEGTRAGAN